MFQNVSILTEPGTNHDASLFLRPTSLSCRTIFTGRNRRFPCCIRPDQNTPGQTKAPFSPRNAEKGVQVNVFTWPCRNRHSPVRSPQALSSEKLRSTVLSEVLDGTDHLRGVGVLVVVPRHDHRFQSGGFLLVMYNRRDRRVIPSRNSRGTFHPRGKRCHDSLDLFLITTTILP